MNANHTPGPWKYGHTMSGGFGVWCTDQSYNVLDHTAPGINAEANARLIASAPELLAALQLIHDSCFTSKLLLGHLSPGVKESFDHKCRIAAAAIAKATGQDMPTPAASDNLSQPL